MVFVEHQTQSLKTRTERGEHALGHGVGLVVLLLLAPLSVHADSGRDAPTCASTSAQSLPPTLDVDDGACTTVDLGLLQPGDVYAMSIIVVDDAIDVLFFDQNGIQPTNWGSPIAPPWPNPRARNRRLARLSFTGKYLLPFQPSAGTWCSTTPLTTATTGRATRGVEAAPSR